MRHPRKVESELGRKIDAALGEETSISELARRMVGAGGDGSKIENQRRTIQRWLVTENITDESAERLAAALELPLDHFKPERRPLARPVTLVSLDHRLEALEAKVDELTSLVTQALRILRAAQRRAGATPREATRS